MELTKSELEIMDVLWYEGRALSGNEIIESSKNKSWKSSSIHVLLNSLLRKQVIQQVGLLKSGKGYARTFEPTVTSTEYYAEFFSQSSQRSSVSFIVSTLFQKNEVSLQDLDELEKMLEKKRRELI